MHLLVYLDSSGCKDFVYCVISYNLAHNSFRDIPYGSFWVSYVEKEFNRIFYFKLYNPFYDNRGQQTARLCRRVMLQFLTGIAMKKAGMDPSYVNPRVSGRP